jgi:glycosyltransferase involved in cell wall biosynthesis
MKLSVAIITFNEERNIGRCLESIQGVADEVVVLDSFSTDGTEEICKSHGVTFITHAFEGHIAQKNIAWEQTTGTHVLSLDADEALTPELAKSILEVKSNWPEHIHGYRFNRLTNYCGSWVRHSGWYPDTKMRLFVKGKGAWKGVNPHDRFDLQEPEKSDWLKGDLLHYSYYTRQDHYKQIEYFSDIASKELHQRGKRVSWVLIYAKVVVQFLKNFVVKLGFLDGKTGFVIARLSAYATWRKYSKLKALYEA